MEKLKVGELAYWDTVFSGLVPCRVLAISGQSGSPNSSQHVRFEVTAARGPWKLGEEIEVTALWVVPRGAVHGQLIQRYMVEGSDAN